MAKSKKFYQQEYSKHIGATFLFVASFLALVFMSCGVPLGVLMNRVETRSCYTMWGFRQNCWNAAYDWRIKEDDCYDRRTRWETAEAFSIIALFSLLFNIGSSWLMVCGSPLKLITLAIAVFSMATTCVPWAIVTSIYYTHFCGDWSFTHREQKFGTGYILMVLSFALQGVGIIGFIFLEPDHQEEKKDEEEGKSLKNSSSKSSGSGSNGDRAAPREEEQPEEEQEEEASEY